MKKSSNMSEHKAHPSTKMHISRERTLENRYRTVQAYGRRIEAALPNAREVGLVAYVPIQRAHDSKIIRCSRILRRIETLLNEGRED